MAPNSESNRASTRIAIRLIPIFIMCIFVVGTYIYVGHICVQYYIQQKGRTGFGAGMIVFYFVLFFLTMSAYLRTYVAVIRDPGFVPLINKPVDAPNEKQPPRPKRRRRRRGEEPDVEAYEVWVPVDMNPDSPGLENFYSKDIFVCEADGRPKWCSSCRQWKPDRAHHSSELDRCVRKMDHLCPWVGGMVSETSFNFFAQFTFYAASYCALTLGVCAYTISLQTGERDTPDGWVVAGLVLAAFFVLFAGGMALTSLRFILTNMTHIDMFSHTRISYVAVNIPLDSPPSSQYPTIVYPLQQPSLLPPNPPPPSAAPAEEAWSVPVAAPMAAPAEVRDQRAQRKFAILRAESRENLWDLGYVRNWKAVMGETPLGWLLPLKHSPCCDHDSMESDYPAGKLLEELKRRYNLPGYEGTAADPPVPKEHVTV